MVIKFSSMMHKKNIMLNEEDILKFQYGIEVFLYESIKIILISLFFYVLDQIEPFIFSFLILWSIRSFSGGLHFTKMIHCFTFSIGFFMVNLFVLPNISLFNNFKTYLFLCPISLFIIYFFSPITSKYRPITKSSHKKRAKHISLAMAIIWFTLLFIPLKNSTLFITGVWTIFLQSLQLLLSGVMEDESTQ